MQTLVIGTTVSLAISAMVASLSRRNRVLLKSGSQWTARLLTSPIATANWLSWVNKECAASKLKPWSDWLLERPLQPYAHNRVSFRHRVQLVEDHYRAAHHLIPAALQRKLIAGHVVEIGTVQGRQASHSLQVMRSDVSATRQEGEITLVLQCPQTLLPLCRLTFVFVKNSDGTVVPLIGGVQGALSPEAKQRVIFATRDLWGLRPKDALLLLLDGMAVKIAASAILAVGNDGQIVSGRGKKTREKLRADYDAYWLERGAVTDPKWGFALPVGRETPVVSKRDAVKRLIWEIGGRLAAENPTPNS